MRVVVTGGAGFIGSNLCRSLLAHPQVSSVRVLDDLSTGRETNLEGLDVDLVVGSILDEDTVNSVMADADAVVHLAARPSVPRSIENPRATHEVNVNGTINVLEALRARPANSVRIVFASSSSVYGANTALPKRIDHPPRPVSPYAVSKLAGESYVLSYQRCFGIPALAVRFFNVYGPAQDNAAAYSPVIPAFITAALDGRPIPVHGDGEQSRDFTFVGSVADTLTAAVTGPVALDEPLNLAFGVRFSLLEVIDAISAQLGRPLAVDHMDPRPGDVRHSQADPVQMKEHFPDVAAVSLEDGLATTIEWWRAGSTTADDPSPR